MYNLRPEVLESFYYAFRVTGELCNIPLLSFELFLVLILREGDQKYRDWTWESFLAINATARVVVVGPSKADKKVSSLPKS